MEKETRQLELQLMMSMNPLAYYAALYVMYDGMALVLASILTLFSAINLFEYSDLSVVFVHVQSSHYNSNTMTLTLTRSSLWSSCIIQYKAHTRCPFGYFMYSSTK